MIHNLFSVPIYIEKLNLNNKKILNHCLKQRKHLKTASKSNVGGWQSPSLNGRHQPLEGLLTEILTMGETFRKNLIEGILDENFRGSDGNYFKRIGDQAIYLPALYRAAGNWHYEPIVAYHYTIEMNTQTFQTEDSKFQRSEGELLRARGFLK